MRCSKYVVLCAVDKLSLANGKTTPKQKNNALPTLVESLYGSIGKLLPAMVLMRPGLMCTYRQCSIEQQHTLVRPMGEVATCEWNLSTQIGINLLYYVHQ